MEDTEAFQQIVTEQLDIYRQKINKHKHKPHTLYKKMNTKWITDLNIHCKTIKV